MLVGKRNPLSIGDGKLCGGESELPQVTSPLSEKTDWKIKPRVENRTEQ